MAPRATWEEVRVAGRWRRRRGGSDLGMGRTVAPIGARTATRASGEDGGDLGLARIAHGLEMVQAPWETAKSRVTVWPRIPLLGVQLRGLKHTFPQTWVRQCG